MSARIIVVPPSTEVGDIAREMAPSGFELVLARNFPEIEAAAGTAEYMVCYPGVTMRDAFYHAARRLKLVQLLSAGYDDVDLEAARRAKAFGMRVQYYDIARLSEDAEDALGVRFRLLRELLKSSDVVSLHVPLNESTRGMIGAGELALLKPAAILVNSCRGPVVDE